MVVGPGTCVPDASGQGTRHPHRRSPQESQSFARGKKGPFSDKGASAGGLAAPGRRGIERPGPEFSHLYNGDDSPLSTMGAERAVCGGAQSGGCHQAQCWRCRWHNHTAPGRQAL